jgi:TPP-dependent pyruvate/acetoin dehydrogenase alpha subunit
MGTPAERSSQNVNFFTRGDQIPGLRVNAMDILAVKKACEWAKEWTTSGKGPLVMELVTYRYGGHSMSDPGTSYRTRDEIAKVRAERDAIAGLKKYILEWGVTEEQALKDIDKSAKAEVEEAVEEAKKSPMPDLKAFWTDIYVSHAECLGWAVLTPISVQGNRAPLHARTREGGDPLLLDVDVASFGLCMTILRAQAMALTSPLRATLMILR